jgi:hypothetical protein
LAHLATAIETKQNAYEITISNSQQTTIFTANKYTIITSIFTTILSTTAISIIETHYPTARCADDVTIDVSVRNPFYSAQLFSYTRTNN